MKILTDVSFDNKSLPDFGNDSDLDKDSICGPVRLGGGLYAVRVLLFESD